MAQLPNRQKTAAKLTKRIVAIKCQMASIRAKSLYSYIPNIVDLQESQRLADYSLLVYLKIAEIYQQPCKRQPGNQLPGQQDTLEAYGIPSVEQLAADLEPILMEYQQQHMRSEDWRTLGFLTTLLNFSNSLILQTLSAAEKTLVSSYLRFVEEQVAIPWQRVCIAAAPYSIDDPKVDIVEQALRNSSKIAEASYRYLVRRFPSSSSRRGPLSDPNIQHSCIRDMAMCQAYFWLAFLEDSAVSLEQELVPLCLMVFPAVEVSWELIDTWNQTLCQQILAYLQPRQAQQVRPYTEKYLQCFRDQQADFQKSPQRRLPQTTAALTASQETLDQLLKRGRGAEATIAKHPPGSAQTSEVNSLKAKLAQLEAELDQTRQQLRAFQDS